MCKKSAKPSHHFAIIKIILLYPTELQFNPDKFMVDGGQNGFHQVFVRRRRLEVLMQGWQPTYSLFSTSSSIKSCTWFSVSFIRPNTLTEPG